ncbi:DUF6194 family protein [Actinosynnema sp. CS-041913]|uniref:DUF6194 family protein n=1 Tax=Actinosynnema sp. CS-041913 TaxID=3239917 RepID=UPI003D8C23EC
MDSSEVTRRIREAFEGVTAPEANGDTFFLYDPDGDLPPERQMPFATIVTGDHYDTVSRLDGPDAYRLNIGLTKAGYTAHFGAVPTERDENGVYDTGFDYAARDVLMPHPTYAAQHWVCVVSPGSATFEALRPLLAEAYEFSVRKHVNHGRRAKA